MSYRRLPPRLKIYAWFNTWGVVGALLVALGATTGPRALVTAGLVLLATALLDVAVVFPLWRARRDLRDAPSRAKPRP